MSNSLLGRKSCSSDLVLAEVNSQAAVEFSAPGPRQMRRLLACAHVHLCACTERDTTFSALAEQQEVGTAGCRCPGGAL